MRPVFLASLPISFLESALPLSSRTGNGNSGNEILKGSLSNDDVRRRLRFIALIPSRLIRQMLSNIFGVEL